MGYFLALAILEPTPAAWWDKYLHLCRVFATLPILFTTESSVTDCNRPPARGKCVRVDWRAWLPDEKAQVFHREVRQLESSYAMLSVSLDQAIELWQLGHSGMSLQL